VKAMGMDGLVVHRLVIELNELLRNARLHRIQQPDNTSVHLLLRQPGANHLLVLCANPSGPRVHLSQNEPTRNPLAAPGFCMVLRKHLEPARLLAVEQPGLERVVTLRFEVRDAAGRRAERLLTTELMGRHSNMLLVDPAGPTILDGIRRVSASQSRYREVYPGRPYLPPPSQDKEHPFTVDEDRFVFNLRHTPAPMQVARALIDAYHGIGPDAAREIIARAGLPEKVTRAELSDATMVALWAAFCLIMTKVETGDVEPWGVCDTAGVPQNFWVFPLTHEQRNGERPHFSFDQTNELIDWYFTGRREHLLLEQARAGIVDTIQTALGKAEHRVGIHQTALLGAQRADEHRLAGELLLAHLHQIPAGADKATVNNYYDQGASMQIALDPSLTVAANAEQYFRKYHKARKTRRQAEQQLQKAEAEVAYLRGVLDAGERASSLDDLTEIRDELRQQGLAPREQSTTAGVTNPTASHLTVTAPDGSEILVGKNNRQNDHITMKLARPDDLWLHVKDAAGAHVIVRRQSPEIAPETLSLALQLAALHSQARHSSLVPVDYCERRYVRKPRGAKPGFVIYDHHKTAFVTPDSERLKRLRNA
jgi:predicted ribosome quality control (RQC) complex YloA/Tae2 family protein